MKIPSSIVEEQVRLFHGTTEDAARAIVESGFEPPDADKRVKEIARRYSVALDSLLAEKAIGELLKWRGPQRWVHLATTPGLASSFARRGSEIDHLAMQSIYRLQHPEPRGQSRPDQDREVEWAKAEVSRSFNPALVEIVVPRTQLPARTLEQIERVETQHQRLLDIDPSFPFRGHDVPLPVELASRWIVGMRLVEPCTCWRDGRPCSTCAAWNASQDGWDGWGGKLEPLR